MKHDQNVLPEEQDENSQALLEELRGSYQPEFHNARALARVRARLLAGEGWQETPRQSSCSLLVTAKQEKSDTTDRLSDHVKTRKQNTARRPLALLAATLAIFFLTGALVLTLHLAQRTAPGTGYPNVVRRGSIIEMHMLSPSTGWALSEGNRVLRTTDGGASWQEVTPPDVQVLEERFTLAGPWAFNDALTAWIGVTVNEQQAPEYHAKTAELIFHTTDGGKTWQKTVVNLSGQSAGQLIFINGRIGWLVALPDQGPGPERDTPLTIWHTTDGGKTWAKILDASSSSAPLLDGVIAPFFSFGDEHVGLLVGQNHRLYRTTDAGATWQVQAWPGGKENVVEIGELHFFTEKDALFSSTTPTFKASAFAQAVGVVVYTTHDAGLTWQRSPVFTLAAPQNKQVDWIGASGIPMFLDLQHGWISASIEATATSTGTPSLVQYRTVDGGQHWTPLPVNPLPSTYRAGGFDLITFISSSVGWGTARGSGGMTLWKTEDGGQSWTQVHAHFPSFIQVPSSR